MIWSTGTALPSLTYFRVQNPPTVANDVVNKTYADTIAPGPSLKMFTMTLSNNGTIIALTSAVYPTGTYALSMPGSLVFSSSL